MGTMTTRSRWTVALTALALTATAVAPAMAQDADASLEGTTVEIWTMEEPATLADLVKPFEDATGVEVDVEAVPWGDVGNKLTTAVASGGGPDVSQVGLSLLPTFVKAGALADLAPYLADYPGLDSSNFPDAVSAANLSNDGTVTSVPWVADTRILFYRTDILEEAGLAGPPTTWDEFLAAAEAMAGTESAEYGYYIPQWDAPLPIQFTWQAGGDVIGPDGEVTLDTPEFRKAVDFYLSFFEKGLVPTASDWDQAAGFISGAAPMLISGPYLAAMLKDQAPELDGKWAVTTMPADVAGTALFAGSNLALWEGSDNVPGALALLEFLAAPETQVAWFEATGQLPTNLAAGNDPVVTADPNVAVYTQQLQDAKLLPMVPVWDKVGAEILTSLNKIALEGADKEATLAALFETVAGIE
jgi:multiple sugar transport system substrate-binding protein